MNQTCRDYRTKAYRAFRLRQQGKTFREIRQIMGLSGPDYARNLVARGIRIFVTPASRAFPADPLRQ